MSFKPGGYADPCSIALSGNLVADAELRGANENVCAMRLAYNTRAKQGEEWGTEVNYIDVVVFGARAKGLSARALKGKRVSLTGVLVQSSWQDRDTGENRYRHEIQVNRDDVVDVYSIARNGNGSNSAPAEPAAASPAPEETPF